MAKKDLTTKERLAIVETLLKEVKEGLKNHLAHHFWVNVTLLGCIATEAIAILIIALK